MIRATVRARHAAPRRLAAGKHALHTALATALLFGAGAAAADSDCLPPQLSAQAEGFVEATPDTVVVNVTVSHTAPTLAEAKQRVDAVGTAVIRAADLHGIGSRDLQASKIQAAPDYDWNNGARVLRGQQVSRQFELKLRDVDRYGALVQALADAEVTQIDNIRTEFSTIDKLEQQALKKAIANVRDKASVMAAGFDRKIDGVIAVSESGAARPLASHELRADFAKAQVAGGDAGAALKVGPQQITKSVSATFRLDGDCTPTRR